MQRNVSPLTGENVTAYSNMPVPSIAPRSGRDKMLWLETGHQPNPKSLALFGSRPQSRSASRQYLSGAVPRQAERDCNQIGSVPNHLVPYSTHQSARTTPARVLDSRAGANAEKMAINKQLFWTALTANLFRHFVQRRPILYLCFFAGPGLPTNSSQVKTDRFLIPIACLNRHRLV
jgi:hypothetical protein